MSDENMVGYVPVRIRAGDQVVVSNIRNMDPNIFGKVFTVSECTAEVVWDVAPCIDWSVESTYGTRTKWASRPKNRTSRKRINWRTLRFLGKRRASNIQ